MRSNVTAILVAKHQGEKLDLTLQSLKAQTVMPDRIVVVACGPEGLAASVSGEGIDAVIAMNERASFGQAIAAAERGLAELEDTREEWLWLLAEDSAPEPSALEHLLLKVKASGTAVVAGPKLVDWHDPSRIIELSQGLTWAGGRWVLDRHELDQQQYDHYEDVLGVGPVGMLVRRDVWQRLDGFDPALPIYDDGLDFSVRARLAGYRVIVAPEARLRYARTGIAGPEINHRAGVLRRAHRQSRAASLYRRITYAPAVFAPLMWLGLPIIGVLGMMWALIRERPGTMLGEFVAALQVFFHPRSIWRARANIRRHNTAGWGAVRPLRTERKTVASVRMVRKESILAVQGRQREDLHFVQTGGLALTMSALAAGALFTWWLFGASFVTGGGAGQLTQSLGGLWSSTVSAAAVNVQSLGSFAHTIPADPFAWVLALMGTITFWNPSLAVIILLIGSVPAAALGGWMWASRLTEHAAGRLLAGIAWGASPVLLSALITGRITTLVVVVALPWLLYAASRASQSWSWAGVASFIAAVVLAAGPVLYPAALVLLITALACYPRGASKLCAIAIVPLALGVPRMLSAVASGRPLDMFADPSAPLEHTAAAPADMLLGFPEAGLGGLPGALSLIGVESWASPWIVAMCLVAPLAILAVVGACTGPVRRTIMLGLMTILGMLTAIVAPHLLLVPLGSELVAVSAGAGLALYWIGLISFASFGLKSLLRAEVPVAIVAMVGVVLLGLPTMVQQVRAESPLTVDRQPIPAVIDAEFAINPTQQALVITPLGEDELRAQLRGGNTLTLDRVRTAQLTAAKASEEQALSELVGSLASLGASELQEQLEAANIRFVLLGDTPGSGGAQIRSLLQEALDQSQALSPIGDTSHGLLWRVNESAPADGTEAAEGAEAADGAADASADAAEADDEAESAAQATAKLADDELDIQTTEQRPVSGKMLWAAQLILLGLMFLLALPTGEVRMRPEKHRKPRGRAAKKLAPLTDSGIAVAPAVQPGVAEPDDAVPGATEPGTAEADAADGEPNAEPGQHTATGESAAVLEDAAPHEVSDQTDEVPIITDAMLAGADPRGETGEARADETDDEPSADDEASADDEPALVHEEHELPDEDTIFVGGSADLSSPEVTGLDETTNTNDAYREARDE